MSLYFANETKRANETWKKNTCKGVFENDDTSCLIPGKKNSAVQKKWASSFSSNMIALNI